MDIPVTNLDRAIRFYSAVLGKEVQKLSEGGAEYGLLPHEERNASGFFCARSDSGGVHGMCGYHAARVALGQIFAKR